MEIVTGFQLFERQPLLSKLVAAAGEASKLLSSELIGCLKYFVP